MSKGDVWIAAVLYIGIGIAVLVLVLSAGIPLLNKIRDENTVTQTRDVMIALDSNIRTVIGEGAGSQRIFSMEISRGQFNVNSDNNIITWEMETEAEVVEGLVHIGNLELSQQETSQVGTYLARLTVSYGNIADIESGESVFSGRSDLIIRNVDSTPGQLPRISINAR
jgi:hypothetical protein